MSREPTIATGANTGEETAAERFERVLRVHGPGLSRVAATYARTAAEREDLRQESALALWRALPSFRGESSERTFVFRIAHNVGQSFLVRRRVAADGEVEVVDPAPDPEAQADAGQRRERLMRAIRTLPLGHRQVVTLALEELRHEEIAEVLGIRVGNVAVRLHRAREALRRALEELQ